MFDESNSNSNDQDSYEAIEHTKEYKWLFQTTVDNLLINYITSKTYDSDKFHSIIKQIDTQFPQYDTYHLYNIHKYVEQQHGEWNIMTKEELKNMFLLVEDIEVMKELFKYCYAYIFDLTISKEEISTQITEMIKTIKCLLILHNRCNVIY